MKAIAICALCLVVCAPAGTPADASLRGYAASGTAPERDWESRFRAIPDPARLREYMQHLSAHPHHVGSPYDKENAEWILARFKEFGLDAHIEEYEVLFPTPQDRFLEMTKPTHFTAKLQEPTVPQDPTSGQHAEQLPTYNAYSKDGDVTGPLVYVNFGAPADYEELERLGVSVKGAIVIARYGETWRGIKPKVAAEHGAVGCIIYSDPHDDGYAPGEVYPNGPMRPKEGVQRGSVMDMPIYPGDPLTPGIGATKDAKRLPLSEVQTITKIPVLPISYGDAEPLLAAIGGRTVPAAWRGSLPITYKVGPGPATVHLRLKFNWDVKPIYDVIARIPGSKYPNEWIIRGNHHDAWVNGAEDPLSGMSPVLEEARAFGQLLKQGWKPKRTILIAAWDGEEPGLLGSTEWAEAHAAELEKTAAVYINSDTNGRGVLGVEGSHSLEKLVNDVAKDITDPESHGSVWTRMRDARLVNPSPNMPPQERTELRTRPDLRIGALGSGSDYTAFIDHLGIASVNLGFGGEDREGIYHSIYDDFYWYTHFSDSDFVYGRALAQTAGTLILRLADADVLPLDYRNFTDTINRYVQEVEKLARDRREQIIERNRSIDDGVYRAANDPRFPLQPPKKEEVPPFLNFAPLENGVADLQRVTEAYEHALATAAENGGSGLERAAMREINQKLIAVERSLTLSDGLPNRPWFKNMIYAPGFYTGYGVKTLPGVREAIEQKQWKEAEEQIARTGRVLENCGEAIQGATAALK